MKIYISAAHPTHAASVGRLIHTDLQREFAWFTESIIWKKRVGNGFYIVTEKER